MLRHCSCLTVAVLGFTLCHPARAELLGYWSADSTGGTGTVLPNDQGNHDLDGELFDAPYTASGEGHTGQVGDYAISFFGEDDDYAVLPATEATFDEITITAWVNGFQNGAWAGLVLSRDPSQPIGLDIHSSDATVNYIWNNNSSQTWDFFSDLEIPEDQWTFVALSVTPDDATLYSGPKGETLESAVNDIPHDPQDNFTEWRLAEDDGFGGARNFAGLIDDVSIWNEALTAEQLESLFDGSQTPLTLAGIGGGGPALQAGDADMDLDFDQLDLVKVQVAAKYLTGQPATWGEGDWDGAPGGEPGNPPTGNGLFDQLDIIAALAPGHYLTGPYAAIQPNGAADDAQTSIGYDARTGELWIDAPAGTDLTSVNIDSAAGIFTGAAAENLGGSFDNDADNNIFKATFGSSFGMITFGNVAQTGLSEEFVAADLSVVGSLAGGGSLGEVDLIYIPEPSSCALVLLGLVGLALRTVRGGRVGPGSI